MSTPLHDAFILGQATRRSARSGAPRTRLRGRKLILARVLWLAVVSLIVTLFLARLPAYSTALQTSCTGATCGSAQPTPGSVQAIQKLGLSVGAYATFTLALTIALAFLCFTLAAVIFWRKSNDWMALLVALAVVASVTLNENVFGMDMTSAWGWLAMVLYVLGNGVYVLVLSLSDGRFVTRWAPWLLLCWVLAVPVYFMFMSSFFYPLVWYAALVLLGIAQFYRSRTTASPLQRQQTKWLFFGGSVAGLFVVGSTLPLFLFPSLGQAGSLYQLLGGLAYSVILFIFPLCLGLAILRYRYLDIDLIIRRTVIYSTLTVLLAVVYAVSVFTLQSLLGGLTLIRGNQLAIIASTLVIAGLFKPLHDRTRALIDRRFYRRKYDAARTLAAFSATIRDEVDVDQLGTKLMAVVEETMQPVHVSLWLCPPKHYTEETTRALPRTDTVGKP
ncbi:MAG TPA: hypothetical protein VF026_25570 [Ktedonobacteraceae bacterium]